MKKLIYFIPLSYMALIWFLSSQPSDAVIDTKLQFDDLIKESLHLIEFGILYLLFVFSLKMNNAFTRKTNIAVFTIAIAYGLMDEIHQYFVPYRSATAIDFIKDVLGVVAAFIYVKRKKMNHNA